MKIIKKISEEYLDKIIFVAYGDAGILDRMKIYFDAKRNPDIKKILAEYRETAKGVHWIKPAEYPGRLPVIKQQKNIRLLNYLDIFFKRPALSMTIVILLTAGVAGYYIINNNSTTNGYSKQELMVADRQAKESFAIVASIFNETENRLKNEVINKKVNGPINKSLTIINTYL